MEDLMRVMVLKGMGVRPEMVTPLEISARRELLLVRSYILKEEVGLVEIGLVMLPMEKLKVTVELMMS
jgi:hypothetical protein